MATLQPAEPGAQLPPASKATHALDPEEIKLFMKQGEQFIAAGDVVTARIVLRDGLGDRRSEKAPPKQGPLRSGWFYERACRA